MRNPKIEQVPQSNADEFIHINAFKHYASILMRRNADILFELLHTPRKQNQQGGSNRMYFGGGTKKENIDGYDSTTRYILGERP